MSAQYEKRRNELLSNNGDGVIDAVVVYGNSYTFGPMRFLSGVAPRRDTHLAIVPGSARMFTQFFNHVPDTASLTDVPVQWGGVTNINAVTGWLGSQLAEPPSRLGVVGPLPYRDHATLREAFPNTRTVDLTQRFWKSRLVKDADEIERTRRGAELCDRALGHLESLLVPGITERSLVAEVAAFCAREGGHLGICFVMFSQMSGEGRYVPAQHVSDRELEAGDLVVVELSAGVLGFTGQILRTFSLGQPSQTVGDLHDVATAAFDSIAAAVRPGAQPSDLVEQAAVIDQAGMTICDDVVHGYGGGYLDPILQTPATTRNPVPSWQLEEGMMVVVQPNVVAANHSIGVQTGELIVVTPEGHKSLHSYPRGLIRV